MARRRTYRGVNQLRNLAKEQFYGVDPRTWDRLTAGERAAVRVFAEALREVRGFEVDLLRLGSEHIRGLTAELSRQHVEAVADPRRDHPMRWRAS